MTEKNKQKIEQNSTKMSKSVKLHIGGGDIYLPGWTNIDDNTSNTINKLDLSWDLMKPLPFNDETVDIIYDKHFYDKVAAGEKAVKACLWNYRCILKKNGLLKIAVPLMILEEKLRPWLKSLGFAHLEFVEVSNDDQIINKNTFNTFKNSQVDFSSLKKLISAKLKANESIKLHIGCGKNYFEGWINIDNNSDFNISKLDLNWDLRNGIPFKDNTVDYIYNEHFLEHLDPQEGLLALKEFKRVLKSGGVLRIAMPDLKEMINLYNNENWFEDTREGLAKSGLSFIKTKAEFLNINFREWGHKWLYDWEELERRLAEAGFSLIIKCSLRDSNNDELINLETRNESTLIAEAIKV